MLRATIANARAARVRSSAVGASYLTLVNAFYGTRMHGKSLTLLELFVFHTQQTRKCNPCTNALGGIQYPLQGLALP